MSTPVDLAESEFRNSDGFPSMLKASPGAAIHVGGDCNSSQASGASIVWREQPQKYLVPVIVLLVLVLLANAITMGLNLSRQASIEHELRNQTVAQDLRRYETEQLRVQAQMNGELQKLILQRGCQR